MAQPYVGELRMFAGNFNPAGWRLCQGQTMPINENETLFNLIGTTYGGDGQTTFNLPDLQGRVPVHQGLGTGMSQTYAIGEMAGVEEVSLSLQQIPNHTHGLLASTSPGNSANPGGNVIGSPPAVKLFLRENPETALPAAMVLPAGGSQPHDNRLPYLTINYIISLFGLFPTQS
jgi:microcystin-dependent protein